MAQPMPMRELGSIVHENDIDTDGWERWMGRDGWLGRDRDKHGRREGGIGEE